MCKQFPTLFWHLPPLFQVTLVANQQLLHIWGSILGWRANEERSHATKLIISHSQKNISELLDAKGQHTCTYQWKCLVIMLIIGYQYKLPQDWHHHSNVTSKQSHTLTSTICCRYFVMLSNELTFVMSYTIITPCSGRGVYLQDGSRMVNYTQILKTWMICQRL